MEVEAKSEEFPALATPPSKRKKKEKNGKPRRLLGRCQQPAFLFFLFVSSGWQLGREEILRL